MTGFDLYAAFGAPLLLFGAFYGFAMFERRRRSHRRSSGGDLRTHGRVSGKMAV